MNFHLHLSTQQFLNLSLLISITGASPAPSEKEVGTDLTGSIIQLWIKTPNGETFRVIIPGMEMYCLFLTSSDNKYIISNAGDETTVKFDAKKLPELKSGWKRDFLIHSVGWVKDGDINTAFGNTVLPLPFHGMKSYPPGPGDNYPNDPELQKYNQEYNTRVVTPDRFLNALRAKY